LNGIFLFMTGEKAINCVKCINYHVTWDVKFPHGCKLWNVKSAKLPKFIVFEANGKQCEYFKEKTR